MSTACTREPWCVLQVGHEEPCRPTFLPQPKCRYSDCVEQHPIAVGEEQVTCPTCRAYLGLEKLP